MRVGGLECSRRGEAISCTNGFSVVYNLFERSVLDAYHRCGSEAMNGNLHTQPRLPAEMQNFHLKTFCAEIIASYRSPYLYMSSIAETTLSFAPWKQALNVWINIQCHPVSRSSRHKYCTLCVFYGIEFNLILGRKFSTGLASYQRLTAQRKSMRDSRAALDPTSSNKLPLKIPIFMPFQLPLVHRP